MRGRDVLIILANVLVIAVNFYLAVTSKNQDAARLSRAIFYFALGALTAAWLIIPINRSTLAKLLGIQKSDLPLFFTKERQKEYGAMLRQRLVQLRWLLENREDDESRAVRYCRDVMRAYRVSKALGLQGIIFSEFFDPLLKLQMEKMTVGELKQMLKELETLSKKG